MTNFQDFADYAAIGGPEGIDAYYDFVEEDDCDAAYARYLEDRCSDEYAAFEAWEVARGCAADPQSGY